MTPHRYVTTWVENRLSQQKTGHATVGALTSGLLERNITDNIKYLRN